MTTRASASFFCPSSPISLNNTWREYRSSISNAITSAITFIQLSNQYYRCAVLNLYFCEQRVPLGASSNPKTLMLNPPEFRGGLLVWGRAPSPVQAERSSAASCAPSNFEFPESSLRLLFPLFLFLSTC